MHILLIILVTAIGPLLFGFLLFRRFQRNPSFGLLLKGMIALGGILILSLLLMVMLSLNGYHRITKESAIVEIFVEEISRQRFVVTLYYDEEHQYKYPIRGDQWQVDAHIVKMTPMANMLGFDAIYSLDRLTGRYANPRQEETSEKTVHGLNPYASIDIWKFINRFEDMMPGFDARYGNAVFMPMADGAEYYLFISQTGLLARPSNEVAVEAVRNWQ
jgi:hypothetical protein